MSGTAELAAAAPTLADVLDRTVPDLRLVRLRREPRAPVNLNIDRVVTDALTSGLPAIAPGLRVAVAVGSRGITNLVPVVATTVAHLHRIGARPFIVPAMGSHGGGTAEGQRHLLAELGITPETVDAPVMASMDTVQLGTVEPDLHVFFDRHAAEADAVLLINRVKSHTSFTGEIESGLAKMLAIGLGKQTGAQELHRFGPLRIEQRIRSATEIILGQLPILGGLALVEDGAKHLHRIAWLAPEQIGADDEAELLRQAKGLAARLPVAEIDVLIVDAMGKDYSGTGMDTNVIGRMMIRGSPELTTPVITNIVALCLTPASGGNATGLGLADYIPARLLRDVDLQATYANSLTAGLQGVQRGQVPITLATDRDAVHAAVLTAAAADIDAVRVVRIHDTVHLDDVMVSASVVDECLAAGYEYAQPMTTSDELFSDDGQITAWPSEEKEHR